MLAHAECNGYIAGNWNLVKLLLSSKEIVRYRVCTRYVSIVACILTRLLVCRIIVIVPCGLYRETGFCDVQEEVALFIRVQSNIFCSERISKE